MIGIHPLKQSVYEQIDLLGAAQACKLTHDEVDERLTQGFACLRTVLGFAVGWLWTDHRAPLFGASGGVDSSSN